MWKKSLYSNALLTPGKIQSAYYDILSISYFLFEAYIETRRLSLAWNCNNNFKCSFLNKLLISNGLGSFSKGHFNN